MAEDAPDTDAGSAHGTDAVDALTPSDEGAPRVLRLLDANGRAAWMLVGIILAIGLLGFVFSRIQLILLAIFVALVHAAIVTPVANFLERRGLGRRISAAVGLLVVVAALGGATGVVVYRVIDQLPDVIDNVESRRGSAMALLSRPPLSMTEEEIGALLDQGVRSVSQEDGEGEVAPAEETSDTDDGGTGGEEDGEPIDDGEGPSPSTVMALLRGSAAAMRVLGAAAVGVVLSFFLVRDRDQITDGAVRHLAGGAHGERARDVLRAAWHALDGYVRAAVMVGALEATVIGIALLLVGTPLAGVLAVLTFLAAFVPVVGATVAGVLAVLMTWLGVGVVEAVIVGVVVLVVQQVDSNVLQPAIVATHTRLHPIATILALMLGGLVGGILGALLAVPTAAVLVAVAGELLSPGEPLEGATS